MIKPLTLEQAKSLKYNQELYLLDHYDSNGEPSRVRVSGKVQIWKTRPNDFRVPVKRGLYENGEIVPHNMTRFSLTRPESIPKKDVYKGKRK